VLTPAKTLLDVGNVAWVQVHLADGGGIGVYPGHAPLLAETLTAPLRYADPAGEHTLDLEAGILEIGQGSVTVFTNGPAHHEDTADMDHASADIADVDRASVCASDARFDRLAQALLDTLKEQADEVLGREDERGT
jgi:F0F1-type ATP synthase epsilon subunit